MSKKTSMLQREEPHVVIIGAGFGGLAVARGLKNAPVRITIVDRSNHHLFQPLLYQVATAALAAPDIATPTRKLLWKQPNATVWMATVTRIQVEQRQIVLNGLTVDYDYLVVAAGMSHTYFGHDEWAKHAPGLKTLGEALDVRRRILRAFEQAELEPSPKARRAYTTFVVIGGGPTGVELAGALAEIAGRTLARDFRRFDPTKARVVLIERGPRLLAALDESLSEKARRELEGLGIEVRTGISVTDVTADYVEIGDEQIATRTVLWAAGVVANPLAVQLGVATDRQGRVWVDDELSVPNRPEVYVVGDLIARTQDGRQLPAVAPLALQSGVHVAENIKRTLAGAPRKPFVYRDKGSMATIGRHKAVAQIGRFKFTGIFAWWLWLFVHVMSLVDHKRRITVLLEWAWAYFTWQRRSRVILEVPTEIAEPPAVSMGRRVSDAPSSLPRSASEPSIEGRQVKAMLG